MIRKCIIQNHKDSFSSKEFIYFNLLLGLIVLTYAIITQQWIIFYTISLLPIIIIILLISIKKPIISYLLYTLVISYFHAIYRYTRLEMVSGVLDIFLALCFFSLIINFASHNTKIMWKNGINFQLLVHIIWILYIIFTLLSPNVHLASFKTSRTIFITTPLLIYISSLLLNNCKLFKTIIIFLSIFTTSVLIKAGIQKYVGWDSAEYYDLFVEGNWDTHILSTGVRYFSFFSDAGTFGSAMGVITTFSFLISLRINNWKYRILCIITFILSTIGMFWSGTRGAIMIPMAALCLYTILNSNFTTTIVTLFLGGLIYCFFAFTYVGQGNEYIRRMRTAFRPTKDASFNVRLENQKRFAHYLKNKPFGFGTGQVVFDTENISPQKNEDNGIPTDSEYVQIWVENGIVGLFIYISLRIALLLRCSYVIMFKIRNYQLKQILAAMLCSVFGLWINGYVGLAPNFQINVFYIIVFLSFVLNGPYIDKKLSKNEIII